MIYTVLSSERGWARLWGKQCAVSMQLQYLFISDTVLKTFADSEDKITDTGTIGRSGCSWCCFCFCFCDRDKSMLSWNFINVSDKEAFLNISTAVISFQSIALLAGAYLESPAVTLTLLWSENQRSWGRTQHFGEVVLLGLMVPKEAPAERAVDA